MNWIRFSLSLILIVFAFQASADQFRYSANIPATDSSGFFRIQISPKINSKLKNDFSDLRLFDADKKEVPYILKTDDKSETKGVFQEYEIISRNFYPDSITEIIIKNNTGKNINNVSLIIRNADVSKEMKISGSFDKKQWFVVKNAENIYSMMNDKNVSEVRVINFPLTNYLFYRIELDDRKSQPVDIIKIGYYENIVNNPVLSELGSHFIVSDSAKMKSTWVHVIPDEFTFVDEISFSVTSPAFFKRSANIYADEMSMKRRIHSSRLTLNSNESLRFKLSLVKTKDIWIEILNEDNPPLQISEIKCFQYNQFIVARLEKDKSYQLLFGDSSSIMPQYDLHFFENLIPSTLPTLVPGEVTAIPSVATVVPMHSFFTDKRFIWASLIVVLGFLGIVTFRMMKDNS